MKTTNTTHSTQSAHENTSPAEHPVVIGLIRHARTQWNMEKRIQGSTDKPLCPEGEADALAWGQGLAKSQAHEPWQHIICSTLTRARQTAEAINTSLHLPLGTDHRLREQDWGEWEGHTIKELRQSLDGEVERQEARGWHFTPTGGESRIAVRDRMLEALTDIAREHQRNQQAPRILIVSHLSCIKTVIHTLLERNGKPVVPDPLQKHGLHRLVYTNGSLHILDINGEL